MELNDHLSLRLTKESVNLEADAIGTGASISVDPAGAVVGNSSNQPTFYELVEEAIYRKSTDSPIH